MRLISKGMAFLSNRVDVPFDLLLFISFFLHIFKCIVIYLLYCDFLLRE